MSIIAPPEEPTTDLPDGSPAATEEVVETNQPALDERAGLPSASSFQRYATCPGSIALEFQLREAGQLPVDHGSGDANTGTRIHEILERFAKCAANPTDGFDPEEIQVAEDLWERARYFITRTFGEDLSDVTFIIEARHWLTDSHGNRISSGRFDLMAHDGIRGLVIDYKTLFGDHAQAAINRQLQFGAVILREAYGIREGTTVLFQRMKPNSFCHYTDLDLEDWLEEIDAILERKAKDPFALGFVRSDYCTYCACRLACPRLQYEFASIQASPLAIIASATDEQIGAFLDKLECVEPLKKAAQSEAEARIKAGRSVPGWKLEAGPARRNVVDAKELGNRLTSAGASLNAVLGAIKMSVGDAEAIHKAITGLKGKPAAEAFNELAAGTIEKKEPAPSLKRA